MIHTKRNAVPLAPIFLTKKRDQFRSPGWICKMIVFFVCRLVGWSSAHDFRLALYKNSQTRFIVCLAKNMHRQESQNNVLWVVLRVSFVSYFVSSFASSLVNSFVSYVCELCCELFCGIVLWVLLWAILWAMLRVRLWKILCCLVSIFPHLRPPPTSYQACGELWIAVRFFLNLML